jgi:hypothetical protein
MSAFEEELKPDIEASRIISDEVSMTVFCNTKVGPLKNNFSSYVMGFWKLDICEFNMKKPLDVFPQFWT